MEGERKQCWEEKARNESGPTETADSGVHLEPGPKLF
jgi:hypothetical protein